MSAIGMAAALVTWGVLVAVLCWAASDRRCTSLHQHRPQVESAGGGNGLTESAHQETP